MLSMGCHSIPMPTNRAREIEMHTEGQATERNGQGVDVLRAIGDAAEVMGRDGYSAIPNDLIAASAAVAELIDSHARLLAAAEAAGWPKTAEQMTPMNEARRIAAALAPFQTGGAE